MTKYMTMIGDLKACSSGDCLKCSYFAKKIEGDIPAGVAMCASKLKSDAAEMIERMTDRCWSVD